MTNNIQKRQKSICPEMEKERTSRKNEKKAIKEKLRLISHWSQKNQKFVASGTLEERSRITRKNSRFSKKRSHFSLKASR
jgi:hypothetical protein